MTLADPRIRYVEKAVGAQNTFSDPVTVGGNKKLTLSISGTFSATVVLQRKRPGGSYVDIASYTGVAEKIIESCGNWVYRAGVKTGGYSSGTANIALAW